LWRIRSSLKASGYYIYLPVELSEILRFVHTLHLCVLYGFQNKHLLLPYTVLTD
jgi:hypothetical protein